MNINKLSKLFLPALMVTSSTLFITGCDLFDGDDETPPALAQCEDGIDNDTDGLIDFPDDPGCIDALDNDETDPPPVPTDGSITGIWTGTFTKDTTNENIHYDVTMLFHMPDDPKVPGRGNSGGAAFGDGPTIIGFENPHFLFEGGYEYSVDAVEAINPQNGEVIIACDADVWAVGRGGTKGTFIQEFSYELGSAAGPDQRGAGCLYLRDTDGDGYVNELTGEIQFEEAGKLQVALTYSSENTRASSVNDLDAVGSDDVEYHLWSNDNSGTSMAYSKLDITSDTLDIAVVENRDTGSCGGNVKITKVAGHNLFTLETMDPHLAGCNVSADPVYPKVEMQHFGLGALVDVDGDDKPEFVHLMASQAGDAPDTAAATALHNHFKLQ